MTRPAADSATARTFFDRLLGMSREAHRLGLHEVAYHALCGALHAAQYAHDSPAAVQIADEAREQIEWIDTHEPQHRLSTSSANRHDHPGVYAMLERQAEAISRMLGREGEGEERVEGRG